MHWEKELFIFYRHWPILFWLLIPVLLNSSKDLTGGQNLMPVLYNPYSRPGKWTYASSVRILQKSRSHSVTRCSFHKLDAPPPYTHTHGSKNEQKQQQNNMKSWKVQISSLSLIEIIKFACKIYDSQEMKNLMKSNISVQQFHFILSFRSFFFFFDYWKQLIFKRNLKKHVRSSELRILWLCPLPKG